MQLPRAFAVVLQRGNQQDDSAWVVNAQYFGDTLELAAGPADQRAFDMRRTNPQLEFTVRVGLFTHATKQPEVKVELIPLGKR